MGSSDESDDGDRDRPSPPLAEVHKADNALRQWLTTGLVEPPSEQVATCLPRPLRNGAHGGTTMTSRSKRDAKNLGLDGPKPEVLGRGRVRKAPQASDAGQRIWPKVQGVPLR